MIKAPVSRKSNVVVQELGQEVLIYDLNVNKALCLNQTAGLVYQLADGTRTVAEIGRVMSRTLKTAVSEELVWLALAELQKDDLLENGHMLNNSLAGISRREAAQKVGLASLAALPIIASVVAPNSAAAQSGGLALYSSCSAPGQCATGNCTIGTMICCVPGVGSFADGSDICAAPGSCPSFNSFCCSGPLMTSTTACPGGFICVCA